MNPEDAATTAEASPAASPLGETGASGVKRDHAETTSVGETVDSQAAEEGGECPSVPPAKKPRLEEIAAPGTEEADAGQTPQQGLDMVRVRRQIEYYFSDNSLRYDAYFQERMKEADGWLDIKHVLSCQKVKDLKATAADVVTALKSSELIVENEEDPEHAKIKRKEPLPPLEQRPKGSNRTSSGDPFAGGPILECGPLPEEATWEKVKAILLETINSKIEATAAEIRPPFSGFFFVSNVVENKCFVLVRPFSGDKEWLANSLNSITVCNTEVKVTPVTDAGVASKAVGMAPAFVRDSRGRASKHGGGSKDNGPRGNKRGKGAVASGPQTPVKIGGMDFHHIGHLGTCLKQVLDGTSGDDKIPVNDNVSCVLEELLREYHPRGAEKLKDKVGFVSGPVEDRSPGNKSAKKGGRCFYIKKSDDTYEDFSIVKCLTAMRQPPTPALRGKAAEQPAEAKAAEQPAEAKAAEQPAEAKAAEQAAEGKAAELPPVPVSQTAEQKPEQLPAQATEQTTQP